MGKIENCDDQLLVRLSTRDKAVIEEAAAVFGQSIDEFVVRNLVSFSSNVLRDSFLRDSDATALSDRDRDRIVVLLDDADAQPNDALIEAAHQYQKRFGRHAQGRTENASAVLAHASNPQTQPSADGVTTFSSSSPVGVSNFRRRSLTY